MYANATRTEPVAEVTLPVSGDLGEDAWAARLVALLAWSH